MASFNAFSKGLFSSKPTQRCQADAPGLMALTARQLGAALQVGVGIFLGGGADAAVGADQHGHGGADPGAVIGQHR